MLSQVLTFLFVCFLLSYGTRTFFTDEVASESKVQQDFYAAEVRSSKQTDTEVSTG